MTNEGHNNKLMKIAIQETLIPGRTLEERYQRVADLGIEGIELQAEGLEERLYDTALALDNAQLPVAAVNLGGRDGYLSPEMWEREAAISFMRRAMATAIDLQADQVIFVPHWGPLLMPDLTPYRSPYDLSSEMMIWLLRTVADLAYALGITLTMQPRNRYETPFMTTVAQAYHFAAKVKYNDDTPNHPYVRIAPHLFDMALEERDIAASLTHHADRIGYLHISDSNNRLPGQGLFDWEQLAETLKGLTYDGWLCLAVGARPQPTSDEARMAIYAQLPACLKRLQQAGLRAP